MANLIDEIDKFLADKKIGGHRFGILAVGNGRLVERLRKGRRVWPETEMKVRAYMLSEREKRPSKAGAEA